MNGPNSQRNCRNKHCKEPSYPKAFICGNVIIHLERQQYHRSKILNIPSTCHCVLNSANVKRSLFLLGKISPEKRSGSLKYLVHFRALRKLQIFRHTVVVFSSGLLCWNNGTASCLKTWKVLHDKRFTFQLLASFTHRKQTFEYQILHCFQAWVESFLKTPY